MNNKGNYGLGCLIGILFFSFWGGNIALFSGSIASGGDLEGNLFAILMVIIAIIADIAIVCYIISACIKCLKIRKENKEKQRIDDITKRVNKIIQQFTPSKAITLQKGQPFSIAFEYINKDIVFTVNQFKDNLKDEIAKCREVDTAIANILSFSDCNSVDKKLKYLSSKAEELQYLKRKSDLIHNEISKKKITLINEDEDISFQLKSAFATLLSSKKCVTENFELKDFICENKPTELEYFKFKFDPVILRIGQFYYCLFSNAILVFDNFGVFSSAIDPNAFFVKV